MNDRQVPTSKLMQPSQIGELSERSRDIFRSIVEAYLETGEPIGSRTLSQRGQITLSAASIRNVMSDLEQLGLLEAPHTSAGRVPTQLGLRLFVDGLLEVGNLADHLNDAADLLALGFEFGDLPRSVADAVGDAVRSRAARAARGMGGDEDGDATCHDRS